MDGQAIIAVSAAVVGLTQLAKWSGVPDERGPVVVLLLAAVGTAIWAYTAGNFGQATAFDYFAGWVAVAMTAAGIYGFTRAGSAAVTATRPPPAGAAQDRTSRT